MKQHTKNEKKKWEHITNGLLTNIELEKERQKKKKKEYQPYDFKCHISVHIVVSVTAVVVWTPLFI